MKSIKNVVSPDNDTNQEAAYLSKPYQKFIHYLISIKVSGKINSPHLWVILTLLVICTFIYYAEQILSAVDISLNIDFFHTVHDLHRTLFLLPLIYASITYRLRGTLLCSLMFLLVILPRAFFYSTLPDPLIRPLIFFFFASALGVLVTVQLNYIEYQIKMMGDLQRLEEEIAVLSRNKENLIRFFNMVAHDMKTPLIAVQSYANTMLAGFCGDLNEKQKYWLQRSNIRIEELTELINDILDFARIEKGSIVREMRNISLVIQIKQCISDLQQMATAKQINLLQETDKNLPDIYGSDVHIRRVLNNLIGNAINYTPENGEITVRAVTKDYYILVEVIDNGIGIPKDELSKVFQDFYRASNAKNIKGTGLGLSIAKSIVEIHGGDIWAESPAPENVVGCKFSFTLPIKRETA